MTRIAQGLEPWKEFAPTEIGQLAVVDVWRRELAVKIQRARTRMELIGLDEAEQEQLVTEVAEFKRLARAVSWFQGAA